MPLAGRRSRRLSAVDRRRFRGRGRNNAARGPLRASRNPNPAPMMAAAPPRGQARAADAPETDRSELSFPAFPQLSAEVLDLLQKGWDFSDDSGSRLAVVGVRRSRTDIAKMPPR